MSMTPLQREIADVMLISLHARLNRAISFTLNRDLYLECELLRAQIAALGPELKDKGK